ncbi:MAG: lamin tail domain-containing protein, partial [Verrucomicrobiota bacterium]
MKLKNLSVGLWLLLFVSSASSEVVISEFLASNDSGLQDDDGDFEDWIELENTGASAVNLNGYHLTDDAIDLMQWTLPERELAPGERLVIFASGKNRLEGEWHTNFKLNRAVDGYLALTDPEGAVLSAFEAYPRQRRDIAYGRQNGSGAGFLDPPTPGEKNGSGFVDFVADTQFSVRRGVFDEAFEVAITTETEGAEIVYTLDGNDPTKGTLFVPIGIDYTGPITIDRTTV